MEMTIINKDFDQGRNFFGDNIRMPLRVPGHDVARAVLADKRKLKL